MGDDWNIKAHVMKQLEQLTYLVYEHISKSSVNAVHVELSHKMSGEDKKLISKSGVDLSRLPRTSLLWGHFVTWGYQVRIPVRMDICHRGCAYTLLQTVQRHGVYSTVYGTVHYKEPLK